MVTKILLAAPGNQQLYKNARRSVIMRGSKGGEGISTSYLMFVNDIKEHVDKGIVGGPGNKPLY